MRLKEKYKKEIINLMKKKFGYKNDLSAPRLEKVVINIGLGQSLKNPKLMEMAEKTLLRISGQKPVKTIARKSISAFKIRKGLPIGLKVTLRGDRMYDFVEKLINITLARVRDFRGLSPLSVDPCGNLSIGFREHTAFPEIKPSEVEFIHGIEVTITTTAENKKEGLELLRLLGFPFREE